MSWSEGTGNTGMKKLKDSRAGDSEHAKHMLYQWYKHLACTRSWLPSPAPRIKKKMKGSKYTEAKYI